MYSRLPWLLDKTGVIASTLDTLCHTDYGEHCVVVYPDIECFREVYSEYTRIRIEEEDEIVMLFPFYETTDSMRKVLRRKGIDTSRCEQQGLIYIMDSFKAFVGFQDELDSFLKKAVTHALLAGRKGVSVIADRGSTYLVDRVGQITAYSKPIPSTPEMKVKGFCSYHQADYERLTDKQKEALFTKKYTPILIKY
jgi:hypothetical protein